MMLAIHPMENRSFCYRLRDPEVINRIKQVAEAQGNGRAWREYGRRTFERVLRQVLGLGADLTTKEVATELKVHPNTVLRYIKDGLLPGTYWVTQRKPMVPYRDVEALRARTV